MKKFLVAQNQIDYAGTFSRPAFSLWGQGGAILEGLFKAFEPFQVGFSDIRSETASQAVSDQAVIVNFGVKGYFKFKFDRIEARFYNATDDVISAIPVMVKGSEDWLNSAIVDFSFGHHVFQYFAHGTLPGVTSEDFLLAMSKEDPFGIGLSRGHGMILHWVLPEKFWRVDLTLDHSLIVEKGIFLHFQIIDSRSKIDFEEVSISGRSLLNSALAKIGLAI